LLLYVTGYLLLWSCSLVEVRYACDQLGLSETAYNVSSVMLNLTAV